jgi:hypothetical protein
LQPFSFQHFTACRKPVHMRHLQKAAPASF